MAGTYSLGIVWLIFLASFLLACAAALLVPRLWPTRHSIRTRGQASSRDLSERSKHYNFSSRDLFNFSSRDLVDFLDSERSWFQPRRKADYSITAMQRMRRRAFYLAACNALIFVVVISVWRVRMAPIYDGAGYTPHVDAPPPPPPPISGFYALDASTDPVELARRTNALCAEGSTGVLCATCEPGHYMSSSYRCIHCKDAEFEMHPIFTAAIIIACNMAIFKAWRYRQLKEDARNKLFVVRVGRRLRKVFADSGLFKVSWASYQIIAATSDNLGVRFPRPYSDIQQFITKFTSFSFLQLVPSSCLLGQSIGYLHELHVAVWSPIVLSVTLLVMVTVFFRRRKAALQSKAVEAVLFIFSTIVRGGAASNASMTRPPACTLSTSTTFSLSCVEAAPRVPCTSSVTGTVNIPKAFSVPRLHKACG